MLAARGGIAGLVGRNLEGLGAPRAVRTKFISWTLRTEQRNRVLVDEARRLCTLAAAAGLTLIPLKGAALLLRGVYPDLGMRAMCDLDLLTSRQQLPEMRAFLAAQRYGEQRHELRRAYSHHFTFGRGATHLELHWTALHVMYSRRASDDAILGRSAVTAGVRRLSPADEWLAIALHLAVHRYRNQLKWLVDVVETSRADEPSWELVLRVAKEIGASSAIGHSAWLAAVLLGFIPPPPLLAPAVRSTLLQLVNPPLAIVHSLPQATWAARAISNIVQFDHLRDGSSYLQHKLSEIFERTSRSSLARWLTTRGLLRER